MYETVLLNYLFMVLTMKQTAHGLVPEDVAATLGEDVLEPWVLPPTVNEFFITHLDNICLTQQGLQGALDFYTAHLPSWTESKGYLPGEVRQAINALYPARIEKRTLSGTKSPGKAKKCRDKASSPEPTRRSTRVTKQKQSLLFQDDFTDEEVEMEDTECDIVEVPTVLNVEQEGEQVKHGSAVQTPMEHSEDGTDTDHSDTEAVAFEVGAIAGEGNDIDHSNVWTVPTAQELEQCEQSWITGPVELEEPLQENTHYLALRKQWVKIFCERLILTKPNFPLDEQVAFIVGDHRTYQESLSDEQVVLSLVQNF